MRILLLVLGILVATIAIGSRAEAQNKWCADYARGGGMNCGFATLEQCRATVFGIGGFCEPNTQYQPPLGSAAQPVHRSRRHSARQPS